MRNIIFALVIGGLSSASLGLTTGYSQTAAQRKMIGDDKEATYKADTSIVIINYTAYQKIISVNYRAITESSLKSEFQAKAEQLKQQIAQEQQNRERSNAEIDRLKAELEAAKGFYAAAAKQLKFVSKKADEPDAAAEMIRAKQEARQALIEIRENPRSLRQAQ